MTNKQKAIEAAWLEYYGKRATKNWPIPPEFRRGFEDGVKWERKRCCSIVTGMCFSDNEAAKIVQKIVMGDEKKRP